MSSPSNPERGVVCAVNPFDGGFRFQSSQPRLKRFIMFDHSNGKGRVFFHPAIAQELFGSAPTCDWDDKGFIPDKEVKAEFSASSLVAYRQMVEGAFTSLQSLRASRQNDTFLQKSDTLTTGTHVSSQKPRVLETISKVDRKSWTLDVEDAPQPCVASETLVCEEKPKVLAILPSSETMQDCEQQTFLGYSPNSPNSVRSQISGLKRSEAVSEIMRENTEDLDALLSSDEDDDDDVRSTGHSPDEFLGKEVSCGKEDGGEAEQYPCKRRRTFDEYEVEMSTKAAGVHKDSHNMVTLQNECSNVGSNRRQKIKKTVKALRRMIPGGAVLDTAFVLDKTIMYVKALRDRVNQLEATRGVSVSSQGKSPRKSLQEGYSE